MKESSIDRIFAKSPEEEKKVREVIEKRFRTQENISFKTEREKTPDEAEIIKFIDKETSAIAEKFGGKNLSIPAVNVHIISENELLDLVKKRRGENAQIPDATWKPRTQAIIMKDAGDNLVKFINVLTHEMYHTKAFQSLKSDLEKKNLKWRRGGLSVGLRDRPKEAFTDLDEAVTEYLTHMNIEQWAAKKDRVPEIINETAEKFGESDLYTPTYLREQIRFIGILNEIQTKNPEDFKDRESVFNIFAEAYFTGGLLKLRKIVDQTFGNGSFIEFAKKGLPESKWEKEV